MEVTIIAALAENRAIGKDNDLIWYLPRDMKFFKETTIGYHVIMGRKNFYSIPGKFRPLKNRTNIIVSRRTDLTIKGTQIFSSIEKALKFSEMEQQEEVFIIGGGQVYEYALKNDLVTKMYLTHVSGKFEADVFFPKIKTKDWSTSIVLDHPSDNKNPLDFTIVEYRKNN